MKNDDVMDLIVVFCILSVFMLVLYCFGVATEFSANKDLCEDTETYIPCKVVLLMKPATTAPGIHSCSTALSSKRDQCHVHIHVCRIGRATAKVGWRGTVVERRSLTGELSLSGARPAADG